MNILDLFRSFQTQEQALEHLEAVRWKGRPSCPYCGSLNVGRHASGDRANQRWQCRDCTRAFAVTVGTIFHGTHIPLTKWFLVLALMLNAKKSASADQIARDLGMRRPTVWSMMHRIRVAMDTDTQAKTLLHGIVEADETYVGGKPRKDNTGSGGGFDGGPKGRRRSRKTAVIGVLERMGRVVARPAGRREVSSRGLEKFISKHVDKAGSLLITDQLPAYKRVASTMWSASINHERAYAHGQIHTNSIEGFWSLVKRAHYGSHHHYSRKYMPLYISEACYKYNNRSNDRAFNDAVSLMVGA